MSVSKPGFATTNSASRFDPAAAVAFRALRRLIIAAGVGWSVLFVVIGLQYQLQMYGDGSIFSYSIAVEDAWAFHWHNIIGRLFVYLFSYLPAESYVEITKDAHGGIVLYGFLFFAAPLLGLIATFAADRSKDRILFTGACFSTAFLCPLVFGFPTEMWLAHALFWPTLAVCHYARQNIVGLALVFVLLLSLVFTHDAAPVLAIAIMLTLWPREGHDGTLKRAVGVLFAVGLIWTVMRVEFPPDDYFAKVLINAGLHFFDPAILTDQLTLLLVGTIAGYGTALLLLRRWMPAKAHLYAALLVAAVLAGHWLWFDHTLHAENRYYFRTILLIMTPVLGTIAVLFALRDDRLGHPVPFLPQVFAAFATVDVARVIAGAIVLVMLVHAVETAKFVASWMDYEGALRALAMGTASDPGLGDGRFVSSGRIDADLNRVSWVSTTPYLSILVAPKFAPARLVVDPRSNYFWLSCKTATANLEADRAVPTESRRLVRRYACLHRSQS
jgi:hypothetical protein